MSQITINTINGTPPYSIYVCSTFLLNCILTSSGVTSTPVTLNIPSAYAYSPSVLIKIVDSQSCEFTQVYSCISPTMTPTFTVTPTHTPSNTPTQTVTPSNTQTSYTPTPTPTTTNTPTTTTTLTNSPQVVYKDVFTILVIEPISAATSIGNYMQSQGVNFFGFSNGVAPSTNQVDFENEMNAYLNYPGWTNGQLPRFITLDYPSYSFPVQPTVDLFGNLITRFNFTTQLISANTVTGKAWYTFFISTGYTNGVFQKSIDLSTELKNVFSKVGTNSTYYNLDFDLKRGFTYNPNIRMYTTFPSTEFLLDNIQNIYFKGSVIGP